MNQLITLLTIRTPRRQIIMGLTLYGLIAGVLPYLPQIVPTAAFGQIVPCQDDGFGCGEPIVVLSNPSAVFDRELFTSDGFNTSEVFDVENYRQATFRLAQRGEKFIGNWDKFVDLVTSVTNAADTIHGIPLLITKTNFTTPPGGIKTFFMAALAAEAIFYQDITIIVSAAFRLSADPIERIQLEVEGNTIDVNLAGNTPLHFSSVGEKTVLVTVRFASGFIGKNLFRVIVKSLN